MTYENQKSNYSITSIVELGSLKLPSLKDSFDVSKTRVPCNTKNTFLNNYCSENFYLKLNHFARYDFKDNKEKDKQFIFFNPSPIKTKRPESKLIVPGIKIEPNFGNLFDKSSDQFSSRLTSSAKALFPSQQLLELKFKPEWRFITGLGGHSVYETGITLHHIYGFPYIPASSIKGVLRSWVIYSCFNNSEGRAIQDESFCEVFGCPAKVKVGGTNYNSFFQAAIQGKVCFFDALPLSKPTIEPDIMNPHYPGWYSGEAGKAPVDTDKPTPIFFLTVKETPFQFLLGSKEYDLTKQTFWDKQTLGWWLENALSEHGIGAKTAVGYGYMKKVE